MGYPGTDYTGVTGLRGWSGEEGRGVRRSRFGSGNRHLICSVRGGSPRNVNDKGDGPYEETYKTGTDREREEREVTVEELLQKGLKRRTT